MKQRHFWLLALLSVLTLLINTTLTFAEEANVSGHVEAGVSAMDTEDSPARVNEYVKTSNEDDSTVNPALDLGLHYSDQGVSSEVEAKFEGSDNYDLSIGADIQRIIRVKVESQAFQHWKDHETLDQMGATAREDTGGAQPSVTTDKIFSDLGNLATPVTSVGGVTLDYDATDAYNQELNNDYIVTRKETKAETSLALPAIPNVVIHAGMRIETREGLEQAIGLSKCDGCHVSATGKKIDERTEDFSIGATGKFGPLTIEYEYLNRTFDEDGATPTRFYDDAGNPSANDQLLYEAGDFEFNRTPDSEKDSHLIKARYDFPGNTTLSASYVNADIESDKSEPASDISYSLANGDTLKTEFESYGGKLSSRLGNWRFSVRANSYSIDADGNTIELRDDLTTRDDNDLLSFSLDKEWASAEERDVNELGFDAVYRIAQGTTLRFGYEYEDVDREEAELGETTTSTYKVALKSRINRQFSGRVSYQYQNIDEPLSGVTGIAQGIGTQDTLDPNLWYLNTSAYYNDGTSDDPLIMYNTDSTVWYWNSVYPNRTLDATNLPEDVHEAKISTTWSPKANLSATFYARVRKEENNNVQYEQNTYVPGFNIWYAPSSKVNLTMSYNFSKQDTENRACVGWYHG